MQLQDRPAGLGLGSFVDGIVKRMDQNMGVVCLISLTMQTTFIMLFLRYSKVGVTDNYIASVAVVAVEFIKVFFCTIVVLIEFRGKAFKEVFSGGWLHALKLAVPSILYSFLNNLVHYGLARLQAPHFQIIYQTRILLTAVCSMWLLGKQYTKLKWASLFTLFVGIILTQVDSYYYQDKGIDSCMPTISFCTYLLASSVQINDPNAAFKGTVATIAGASISALAGVYTEKMLKESTTSLWVTNIQLGSLSMIVGTILCYNDYDLIVEKGVFFGWEYITILLVINQAIGGLLVASVFFFADSVAKSYAGSITLVLISLLSVPLFSFHIHEIFIAGATLVVVASYYYSVPDGTPVFFGRFANALPKAGIV